MHRFKKAVKSLKAHIKRGYRVPLPPGLVGWPIGRRVYWRTEAGEVIVELKPRRFLPPRYISSRISKCVFVKRPSWRE
jgi:hypothetical protein